MSNILEIRDLTKNYGSIRALHHFGITVEKGQVYGILGPNGSGKTTTLSVIMGVIYPDSGEFSWFENKKPDWKRSIGSLIEVPNFYPYLTLHDNLKIVARIKEVPGNDIERVLQVTRLAGRADSSFATLSLGMKQRLAIAAVLLGDPEVMVLDEPTNGLDPEGIAEVRDIITDEAAKGKTVILASHILAEVEKVCSHVAVLKDGELLASGRVGELLREDQQVLISSPDIEKLLVPLRESELVKSLQQTGDELLLVIDRSIPLSAINDIAFRNGVILEKIVPVKKSLEDQFLKLVR